MISFELSQIKQPLHFSFLIPSTVFVNVDRSLASTTSQKIANQVNLPQDKNFEKCTKTKVSNGSAVRLKETKETIMQYDYHSEVADSKKPQESSPNNRVCISRYNKTKYRDASSMII